jgi:hypothetical protein
MMESAITNWPLVDAFDDGIRPAGPPDTCFYCGRKVGEYHQDTCVVVKKRFELRITSEDGRLTGLWQVDEPHFWGKSEIEFHFNEGGWCVSNLLGDRSVAWDQPGAWEILAQLDRERGCLCGVLEFTLVRVVDDTPRRDRRAPEPALTDGGEAGRIRTAKIRESARRAAGLLECARKTMEMAREVYGRPLAPGSSRYVLLRESAHLHATAAAELAAAIGFISDI